MNSEFRQYNNVIFDAYSNLIKTQDLVTKKTENFIGIFRQNNLDVKTVLHMGFGPIAIGLKDAGYDVSVIDTDIYSDGIHEFKQVDLSQRYDAVIAPDEYFTFSRDEEEQRKIIASVCDLTKHILITTLADFKNANNNDKEFSDPQSYRTKNGSSIYLEKHRFMGKNTWATKVYKINELDELQVYGPFTRNMLFFKQLARFCNDAGGTDFLFQKNIMYKGMIKKNYEHVIAIKFN